MSGHFVQGHVDTISSVKKICYLGRSWLIDFKLHKNYIFPDGGISRIRAFGRAE